MFCQCDVDIPFHVSSATAPDHPNTRSLLRSYSGTHTNTLVGLDYMDIVKRGSTSYDSDYFDLFTRSGKGIYLLFLLSLLVSFLN
jgi:hypothetical protein